MGSICYLQLQILEKGNMKAASYIRLNRNNVIRTFQNYQTMKKYNMNLINITMIFFWVVVISSCTKEIDVDLNSSNPQVVIEGSITDTPGPYTVKISKTVNFSDANSYPSISGAFVTITDITASVVDTLLEIGAGRYQTNTLIGIQGHTYKLKVIAEGNQYEATSTMPYKVAFDSLRFIEASAPGANNSYLVVPVYRDPIQIGNSYRFILSVKNIVDNSYYVTNDNVANGIVNQRPILTNGSDNEINLGDTVSITMYCIDASTYTYFFTLSQIAGGGPGGGTTPSNPPNNIIGNKALGIFSAYTTEQVTNIAQ